MVVRNRSNYKPEQKRWTGKHLKAARERQNISISEIHSTTKISHSVLRAIEEEDFENLPSSAYLHGFVALLAKELHLPADEVVRVYMEYYRESCPSKRE